MIWLSYIFIGISFISIQGFAAKEIDDESNRSDALEEFIRMLIEVEKPEKTSLSQKNVDETGMEKQHEVSKSIEPTHPLKNPGDQKKLLNPNDRSKNKPNLRNGPRQFEEANTKEENKEHTVDMSPVALYLLKRLLFATTNQRAERADNIIGINSRDESLPWEDDCSGGYDHCGGYFPLCCEGFICLKPLTPWDKAHGFNRCWPSYFQDESDKGNDKL